MSAWQRLAQTVLCAAASGAFLLSMASTADAQQTQPAPNGGAAAQAAAVAPADKAFLEQSETFVADLSNIAIQELVNPNVPREARVAKFRQILQTNFDIDNISRFVLGRYWRVATPQQRTEYRQLFEKLLIKLYEEKFQQYNGQTLTITGSRLAAGGNFALVASKIKDPDAPQPINVEWRVVRGPTPRIADVVVEGMSMGLSQRQEFASVIQRNGGSVEALLQVMRENAATPPVAQGRSAPAQPGGGKS